MVTLLTADHTVQPLQNVLNATARIILRKRKFNHIITDVRDQLHWLPIQQRIEYKVCVSVSWCTSVCIRLHQHTSLNCAYRCLNQPIVVTSIQLLGVTLQFHAPEQRDTAKDVLLFLVQHSGTHFHCLLLIHH